MENRGGIEVLSTLPFTEVAIPMDQAIDSLTERTRRIVSDNIDHMLTRLDPSAPNYTQSYEYFRSLGSEFVQRLDHGGISLGLKELDDFYTKGRTRSFAGHMDKLVGEMVPAFFHEQREGVFNPSGRVLGFVLDAIRLLDPEKANFDDGVGVVAGSIRRTGYRLDPLRLGVIVEDVIERKGSRDFPFDLLADSKGAMLFAASYMNHASPKEKGLFLMGMDMTYEQLQEFINKSSK